MFYLVGIGLKPGHLAFEAAEALRHCANVFLETYTSAYSEGSVRGLEKAIGRQVHLLGRQQVEEGSQSLILSAKRNDIALCVFGNVFSATTHIQLLIEAKRLGVKFTVIPGISIFSFLGKTGLDEYRFGRTTTIVMPEKEKGYEPTSFFDVIEKNRANGLHTLCLLDIKTSCVRRKVQHNFMGIKDAIAVLEKIAKKKRSRVLGESVLLVISNAGAENEKIAAGSAGELKRAEFGVPASLVVCAKLNVKEKEALEELHGWKGK